jgi:proline iminopeptidase
VVSAPVQQQQAAQEWHTVSTPVPLYVREDGPADAPPVVLLHGGPGAHHDYLYPQCLALAARHRLITYDQRGGGRSRTDDPTPITWRAHVEDLAALLRERQLATPTIVGYSWGALLAMLYAIECRAQPQYAVPARLVLISPAPVTKTWRAEFDRTLAARQQHPDIMDERAALAASTLRQDNPERYRQRAFELSVAGYFANVSNARNLTPFRVTGKVQQSVWQSLGDFDLLPALQQLAIPALVVHGRQDPIPLASADATARALHAQFVVLEECGHVPYVEQPDALFDAVHTFLGKTG